MIRQEELEWAYKSLESIGKKLKLLSTFLLTATLLNLSFVFAALGGALYLNRSAITSLAVVVTFMVFFLALWFDSLRKDGKSYYDEISGAMHANSKNDQVELESESIMARISIKKFMNSYEIPLIPGQYGPGVIVAINVMIIVLWVSLSFGSY